MYDWLDEVGEGDRCVSIIEIEECACVGSKWGYVVRWGKVNEGLGDYSPVQERSGQDWDWLVGISLCYSDCVESNKESI